MANIILSEAKNLDYYADLCNEALGPQTGVTSTSKGDEGMVPGEAGPIFEHPIGRETFSEHDLMGMNPVSLRALIRQCAHQIDNGLQRYALRPEEGRRLPERARKLLRACLEAWEKRGYRTDKPDLRYAQEALKRGDEFAETLTYEPSPPHAPFADNPRTVPRIEVQEVVCRERWSAEA